MEANARHREAPPPYSEAIADDSLSEPLPFRTTRLFKVDDLVTGPSLTQVRSPDVFKPPTSGQKLTFCDFLPLCFDAATPDTFSSLLDQANFWLESNPWCRVKTCETIRATVDVKNRKYLTEVFYDDEKKECITVIGLRLWLTTAERNYGVSLEQPKLGVVHMEPLSAPIVNRAGKQVLAFENLQQLLQRYKLKWENEPLPGRFLSLDTCKTTVPNIQSFNPECVVFHREKHYTANTLEMIRVFYEIGQTETENIDIVDFLPVTTIPLLGSVQRESFDELFKRANTWLKKHCWARGHRLLNIQTLELDVRPGGRSDTSRLWATAEAKKEYYVRFLRAAFVMGSSQHPKKELQGVETIADGKTFLPVPVPGSNSASLKFEPLEKCRERLEAWVKATGAQVLSAETVWLRSSLLEDFKKTGQSNATVSSGSRYRWLSAVRLYLDKPYKDPPAAMLPAMPKVESNCCLS